jgi:hypothetical protein
MTDRIIRTDSAWNLIGFDPGLDHARGVRIVGGRVLWDVVGNNGGATVRLARLDTTDGLRAVVRYVHPDTMLDVIADDA